jgi:hypothetical protein
MSLVSFWGSTDDERAASFPCDGHLEDADTFLFRAVQVDATPEVVFRWLCQLRVAPYSYDFLDNFGRRSPTSLTPGLGRLARGQRVMRIFELVDFAPDDHLTLRLIDPWGVRLFGDIAVTYRIMKATTRLGASTTRLVVKMRVRSRPGFLGNLRTKLLAIGDLVMMRKQLLSLKALAEAT